MKRILIISIFSASVMTSCNGQNSNVEGCKTHFKSAKKTFNSYYTSNNQALLTDALKEVELSLQCAETRVASVELKISILSLQKDYDKAVRFIESLDVSDFTKLYKKGMQTNVLKAMNYESKSDLKSRNVYLKNAIDEINAFITKQNSLDQEAYYDLFFVKSKMLSKNELDADILLLQKQHPADKDFFEALRESFNEQPKQIIASPKQ